METGKIVLEGNAGMSAAIRAVMESLFRRQKA
jgi:hypothetical protein